MQAPECARIQDLEPTIRSKLGLPRAGTFLRVFEEVRPGICNPLPPASSLEQAELRDGDILIVQSPSDISAVAEVRRSQYPRSCSHLVRI